MNQDDINKMFGEIMNTEQTDKMIEEMTGAFAKIYQSSLRQGLPEERAWGLAEKMLEELFKALSPLIQKAIGEQM